MNRDGPRGWFSRYVMPGLVFKAAVIGGAYTTGRELAEFFGPYGPLGGLIGMAIAMMIWSVTFAASLEFARITRSYDYKSFFEKLIGRGWIAVEALLITLFFLIIAVLGATAGELLMELAAIPRPVGIALFALAVALIVLSGTRRVEMFLSYWSFVLYAFYAVFLTIALLNFGDRIHANYASAEIARPGSIFADGIRYASYNIAAITMVLFTARSVSSRREAVVAGLLGGPLAMIPGMLFFVAMMAFHPEVQQAVVPLNHIMEQLRMPMLHTAFLIIIVVTLVGAASTVFHSVNERIAAALVDRGTLTNAHRFAIAIVVMAITMTGSVHFGLVELVASGYGYMAIGFVLLFILPILTIGIWRIWRWSDDEWSGATRVAPFEPGR